MENKQPTQEQIKEFWEWCGFNLSYYSHYEAWFINNERLYSEVKEYDKAVDKLPSLDLNNLFRWAMPKLDQAKYYKALSSIFLKTDDPALALFWAIWELVR